MNSCSVFPSSNERAECNNSPIAAVQMQHGPGQLLGGVYHGYKYTLPVCTPPLETLWDKLLPLRPHGKSFSSDTNLKNDTQLSACNLKKSVTLGVTAWSSSCREVSVRRVRVRPGEQLQSFFCAFQAWKSDELVQLRRWFLYTKSGKANCLSNPAKNTYPCQCLVSVGVVRHSPQVFHYRNLQ